MHKYSLVIVAFLMIAFSASSLTEKSYNKGINIVPKPLSISYSDGSFYLNPRTAINYSSPELRQTAAYLSEKLSTSTGFSIKTNNTTADIGKSNIVLTVEKLQSTNEEAYELAVTSEKITIKGNTVKGVFYGVQTLLQLLPAEIESKKVVPNNEWEITNLTIRDEPRFKWRGLLLDICRHFFPADFIKKQLDVLALYKINTLHLHLTDDQGWRIEVKNYPRLTQTGAYRTDFDGSRYGGFLTQEEIKELVKYAQERQITIVPEIEVPGHAKAALASYPEFSCTGGPFTVRTHWGVENDVYCAGKESTLT